MSKAIYSDLILFL